MNDVNKNIKTKRVKDGVIEHQHESHPYWHPVARIHSGKLQRVINETYQQTIWEVDEDGVCDIIEALHGEQLSYIDLNGELQDLPAVFDLYTMIPLYASDWAQKVSEIPGITTSVTFNFGKLKETTIEARNGRVRLCEGHVEYEVGSKIHDARILIETGFAAKYIPFPDLLDALHIMHVSDPEEGYYDLIRLPSGGHVPTEVLNEQYGVSWETLAKIPLGEPRNDDTFACPICGQKSYYAGVCQKCESVCWNCPQNDVCDQCCDHYIARDAEIAKYEVAKLARKDLEHEEILGLIESDNWKNCRYMRSER